MHTCIIYWTSSRARRIMRGRLRTLSLLTALSWALMSGPLVRAAPVTFRFDAEIDRLSGIPFDSGIEFAEGDVISGRFTVEPAEGDGAMLFEAIQSYSFALNINGVVVTAPSFEIEVINDSVITDFPPASQIDSAVLGAGGLAPVQPEMFPNIDAATSNFRMTLFAPTHALNQASIPESVATWNEFDLWRQIAVAFRSGSGEVVGLQATVRQFVVVPEPSTLLLTTLTLGVAFATIRIRSLTFNI